MRNGAHTNICMGKRISIAPSRTRTHMADGFYRNGEQWQDAEIAFAIFRDSDLT
jgi:hypothetical protein